MFFSLMFFSLMFFFFIFFSRCCFSFSFLNVVFLYLGVPTSIFSFSRSCSFSMSSFSSYCSFFHIFLILGLSYFDIFLPWCFFFLSFHQSAASHGYKMQARAGERNKPTPGKRYREPIAGSGRRGGDGRIGRLCGGREEDEGGRTGGGEWNVWRREEDIVVGWVEGRVCVDGCREGERLGWRGRWMERERERDEDGEEGSMEGGRSGKEGREEGKKSREKGRGGME